MSRKCDEPAAGDANHTKPWTTNVQGCLPPIIPPCWLGLCIPGACQEATTKGRNGKVASPWAGGRGRYFLLSGRYTRVSDRSGCPECGGTGRVFAGFSRVGVGGGATKGARNGRRAGEAAGTRRIFAGVRVA